MLPVALVTVALYEFDNQDSCERILRKSLLEHSVLFVCRYVKVISTAEHRSEDFRDQLKKAAE